jgi:hypothetical protein
VSDRIFVTTSLLICLFVSCELSEQKPEDCDSDQLWYDGRCLTPSPCSTEVEHAGLTQCVWDGDINPGRCLWSGGALRCAPLDYCVDEWACADGFFCRKGRCREIGEWCRDDDDCFGGLACYRDHCYALCASTVDCPVGLACRCLLDDCRNQAMCSSPAKSCTSNDDCAMFLLAPGEKALCGAAASSCEVWRVGAP